MAVNTIDDSNKVISKMTLLIDNDLRNLTLLSANNGSLPSINVNMKEINAIFKGPDFAAKVPRLADLANKCVGCSCSTGKSICFHFEDTIERDVFFTCLKIVRMSADISG